MTQEELEAYTTMLETGIVARIKSDALQFLLEQHRQVTASLVAALTGPSVRGNEVQEARALLDDLGKLNILGHALVAISEAMGYGIRSLFKVTVTEVRSDSGLN